MHTVNTGLRLLFFLGTLLACSTGWGMDPRFELDPALIGREQGGAAATQKKPVSAAGKATRYTVKPGDNIRLILKREFGLDEARVDAMTARVREANGITDIRRLKVGSSLLIPLPGSNHHEARRPAAVAGAKKSGRQQYAQSLQILRPPAAPFDAVTPLKDIWPRLVPGTGAVASTNLNVSGDTYTLSLDAARYPVLPGVNGTKILLDTAGTLPPLVRSLVTARDPSVRIVSEDPSSRQRFVAAVLGAAGFYSVEENFSLTVGDDPRLKVVADFKIERSPDSLLKQEVTLLNLTEQGRPLPPALIEYLGHEGFQVLEPYAVAGTPPVSEQRGTLYRLARRDAVSVTDTLLQALDLPVSRDRSVQLFSLAQDGVQLEIKTDRTFTDRGERYVVNFFTGDPVSYTLSRLLETRGYKVIVVDLKDDFPKASERILTRIGAGESYGMQTLQLVPGSHYTIQLTGVALGQKITKGKQVVLTSSELSPLVRELARYNGISVIE